MTAKPVRHLTQEEFAARAHISVPTAKRYRRLGTGPGFIRVHRRLVLYPEPSVEAWERARLVSA